VSSESRVVAFGGVDNWTGSPQSTASALLVFGARLTNLTVLGPPTAGPIRKAFAAHRALRSVRLQGAAPTRVIGALGLAWCNVVYDVVVSLFRSRRVDLYVAGRYGLPLCVLAMLPRVRVIYHSHELPRPIGGMLIALVERGLSNCADVVIAVSQFHSKALKARLGIREPRVVYNCAARLPAFPFRFPLKAHKGIRLVYAGAAIKKKGIEVIASFCDMLPRGRGHGVVLCLSTAGAVCQSSLSRIAATGVAEIRFDVQDVRSVLLKADFLLAPSSPVTCEETFGRVLVEAASAGCWPIATRAGAYPEILGRMGVGDLVEFSDSSEELARRLWRAVVKRMNINVGVNVADIDDFTEPSFEASFLRSLG
jgi:glycosyltransferase involved in cell wall biosynthesis